MHLIAPLISGVAGAENGYAKIRRRGTSAFATCYEDFEGTVLSQPDEGLTLDANGGVEVYVNELVDVEVLDEDGTSVREFTAGVAAPAVEARSASFTGTQYSSGTTGAGLPTTLQVVLDRLVTSFGSTDFNVLFGGSSTTLQNALGSFAGIFRNVQSPQYGAEGDGVVDDTTAIQNAINGGNGIVWFPAGTYKVTAKLTVPVGVSLWGPGAEITSIAMDAAATDILEYGSGTSSSYQEVSGLRVGSSQANSGKVVSLTAAGTRSVTFRNCLLNGGSNNSGSIVSVLQAATDTHRLLFDATEVLVSGASGIGIDSNVGDASYTPITQARNSRIRFTSASAYNGSLVNVRHFIASDCTFDVSAATSGTCYCVALTGTTGNGPVGLITGSRFLSSTGATDVGIALASSNEATTRFSEAGNAFGSTFAFPLAGLEATANLPQKQSLSRDMAIEQVTDDNATNVALSPNRYGISVLTRTVNSAQVINVSVGPPGSTWTLIVYNNTGGNLTSASITFGTGFVTGTTAIPNGALSNLKLEVYHFRSVVALGGGAWVPLAASVHGLG